MERPVAAAGAETRSAEEEGTMSGRNTSASVIRVTAIAAAILFACAACGCIGRVGPVMAPLGDGPGPVVAPPPPVGCWVEIGPGAAPSAECRDVPYLDTGNTTAATDPSAGGAPSRSAKQVVDAPRRMR
jgi:hypothetical protein